MKKYIRYFLSFVFIFLLSVGNITTSHAAPKQYSIYKPGQAPKQIRLQDIYGDRISSEEEDLAEFRVGTFTTKGFNYAKNKELGYNSDGTKIKANQPAMANAHPGKSGNSNTFYNFICLEKGVVADWGRTYSKTGKTNDKKLSALVSYSQSKNWDFVTLQALVWGYQESVKLDSKYQTKLNEFNNAYKNNPNGDIFKKVNVYEYKSDANPEKLQKLLGFEYSPQPIQYDLKIEKSEKDSLQNGEKACNIAPNLYSMDGAQYGIYKSESDAKNKKNVYKTVTLKGNANKVSGSTKVSQDTIYYIREIKTPKGYQLDENIYATKVETTTRIVKVEDKALFDPLQIVLQKTNQRSKGLDGAEFEIKYYPDYFTNPNEASRHQAKKTWIFRTKNRGRIYFKDDYKIGGDDLYKLKDGTTVGLNGTYVIRETQAPNGHEIDPTPQIRHIDTENNKRPGLIEFSNNPINATNKEQVGKIKLNKLDKETRVKLNGVQFDIKLLKLLEDNPDYQNGQILDTLEIGKKEESKELPLGEYQLIEKVSSIEGRGYQVMSKPFHFNILGNKTGSKWASYQNEKNHPDIIEAKNVNENDEFLIKITVGNTPQKGQIELTKLGRRLTGTTIQDKLGYKVTRPQLTLERLP